MSASRKTSWYASFFKILLKKLSLSPSTRKSWVQILVALLITFSIVGAIAWLENEQKEDKPQRVSQPLNQTKIDKINTQNSPNDISTEIANQSESEKNNDKKCKYKINVLTLILCPLADSKLLGQVQNIGVISAAILFFIDTFDRRKQVERQAWQLIDGAKGVETSGGRYQAILDLYKEDKDTLLKGLDVDGADLRDIKLAGANLERGNFKGADLRGANFQNAILKEANFQGAKLNGADFSGAKTNLRGANFEDADFCTYQIDSEDKKTNFNEADLSVATLNRAILNNADFGEANLTRAKFIGADLEKVNLNNANIQEAKFGSALNITITQIENAKCWESAKYDREFCERCEQELGYKPQEDETKAKEAHGRNTATASSSENQLLDKLLDRILNNFDKRKEISEIKKKIAAIVQVLENDASDSLKSKSVLEDLNIIIENVENLLNEDDNICLSETEYVTRANVRKSLGNVIDPTKDLQTDLVKAEELIKEADEQLKEDQEELRKSDELLRKFGINED